MACDRLEPRLLESATGSFGAPRLSGALPTAAKPHTGSDARERDASLSFDEYQALRRFPALDGVRAIAIILVFTAHPAYQHFWPAFHGANGVTVFFVPVAGPDEFDAALAGAKRDGAAGVIVIADVVTLNHRQRFV